MGIKVENPTHGYPLRALTGILVGDLSGHSCNVAALILEEMDGFSERVACGKFDQDLYVRDGTELRKLGEAEMRLFSKWIREDTILRTIRLG